LIARLRRLGQAAVGTALLLVLAALPSCFSPHQPGCAFSCAADGLCPSGYVCGGDGVCHRSDGQGTCDIPPQTGDGGDGLGDGLGGQMDGGDVDGGGTGAD
jgi:hypothetical protein